MSPRPGLRAIILSLLLGGGLFALFLFSDPPEGEKGLCVLTMEEGPGAREGEERLAALLGPGGFAGESGQWVFLADFGTLKRIPLGDYSSALEDFDPRRDGFAERLRAFFIREGKRRVFIPLEGRVFAEKRALEKKLAPLGEEIPFSLEFLLPRRRVLPFFLFLAAAFGGLFFLAGRIRSLLFLLPIFLPLAWGGYAGLALGALLSGLWGFAGEPLREFFARRAYARPLREGRKGASLRGRVFFLNGLGVLLLLLLVVPVYLLGRLPLLPLIAALGSFSIVLLLSFKLETGTGSHIRFTPLKILSRRRETLRALILMGPFALASCAGLLFSLFFSRPLPPSAPALEEGYLVSPEDYRAHADFQASFSLRPLGGGPSPGYFSYYLGEDGLISGREPWEAVPGEEDGSAPFPLEELMDFLLHYKQAGEEHAAPHITVKDWILIVLLFMPLVPLVFRAKGAGKKRKGLPAWDKRIAA
jgi:hypothetical protein